MLMGSGCWTLSSEVEQINRDGVHFLANNDLPKAHAKFVEAWKQEPDNADTLYNLASTYHRRGQHNVAEQYYRQALQKHPDHSACRRNYHLLLIEKGRSVEAIDDTARWRAARPEAADPLAELGWLTRLKGDLPNAQSYLQQALAIDPNHPAALTEMGRLYEAYQMPDRARALYQRVADRDPNNEEVKGLLTRLKAMRQ
jgi:protein O-GlcNAc transferase